MSYIYIINSNSQFWSIRSGSSVSIKSGYKLIGADCKKEISFICIINCFIVLRRDCKGSNFTPSAQINHFHILISNSSSFSTNYVLVLTILFYWESKRFILSNILNLIPISSINRSHIIQAVVDANQVICIFILFNSLISCSLIGARNCSWVINSRSIRNAHQILIRSTNYIIGSHYSLKSPRPISFS